MADSDQVLGLHHVTAFSGSGRRCDRFYTHVLGLRRVKLTVNYDDPTTHHLYYGDRRGSPGTLVTFFPSETAKPGRRGAGQIVSIAMAVVGGVAETWRPRLEAAGVQVELIGAGDVAAIRFADVDGLTLELIEQPGPSDTEPWPGRAESPVPVGHAIVGPAGVRLSVVDPEATAAFLHTHLNLEPSVGGAAPDGAGIVLSAGASERPSWLAIDAAEDQAAGRFGPGVVHHVALAVEDEAALDRRRRRLAQAGIAVTSVRDRQYFKSIYFREPGGVVIELATLGPGFTIDEPPDLLGRHLRLPPWLEPQRGEIEPQLPEIEDDAPAEGA